MTRNRARKAAVRQHAEATGESYTRVGHALPAVAPATVWIEVGEFNGPSWGGDLHSHGVDVSITARADAGRGAWIGPDELPGGVQGLEDALLGLPPSDDGGFNMAELGPLQQVLRSQLPGADIVLCDSDDGLNDDLDDPAAEEFYALQQAQDEAERIVLLFHTELTWDCTQRFCR
jgi:hypothetical protein